MVALAIGWLAGIVVVLVFTKGATRPPWWETTAEEIDSLPDADEGPGELPNPRDPRL